MGLSEHLRGGVGVLQNSTKHYKRGRGLTKGLKKHYIIYGQPPIGSKTILNTCVCVCVYLYVYVCMCMFVCVGYLFTYGSHNKGGGHRGERGTSNAEPAQGAMIARSATESNRYFGHDHTD